MTKFQQILQTTAVNYAKYWRENNCVERDVDCYKYLFQEKYNSVLKEDWCQATTSAIIAQSCEIAGIKNPFKFTLSTVNFFQQAKALGVVDSSPRIGSTFFHYRGGGTSQGHSGVIVGITNSGLYTVEGNSSNALKCFGCDAFGMNSSVVIIGDKNARSWDAMAAKNAVYIHAEKIPALAGVRDEEIGEDSGPQTGGPVEAGFSLLPALLLTGAAIGTYYLIQAGK